MTDSDPPISCKLHPAAVGDRLEEWRQLLGHVVDRTWMADGALRLSLDDTVDVGDLARLAQAEQACCAFFSFAITIDGTGVGLEVRAPKEAADIVNSLFG